MVFHSRKTNTTKSKINLAQWWPYMLHCGMIFIVAVYVLAGAEIIRRIEAKGGNITQEESPLTRVKRQPEHEVRHSMSRTKNCVLSAINRMASSTNCVQNVLDTNLAQLDHCYMPELLRLQEKATQESQKVPASSTAEEDMWSLTDAVLFCFTVITTIGYGNVVPRTDMGRLFVIFYGLIGVPITMLVIANLGKFLATLLKFCARPFIRCMSNCRRGCRTRGGSAKEKECLVDKQSKLEKSISEGSSAAEDPEIEESAAADGAILFLSFIIYIIVGSLIIAAYEPNMDFFSAIYFNFVTLTTIGLGDLVPQKGEWLVFTLIYVAIGLALTTIAIEIAADTLKKLHYFGRKIENVGNVQIWFGGQKISMKALVKNLGDQLNVPIEDLENLNIDKFVDDAIKVEAGELSTLRQDRDWMNSNYWRAIESGSMHYVDDDDLVTLQSNRPDRLFLRLPISGSKTPMLEILEHAPFVPTPCLPTPIAAISSNQIPFDYGNASLAISMGSCPIPNIEEGAEQLIKVYKKTKREKDAANSRWSAEAKKRYDEYCKMWSKFRQTSVKEDKRCFNEEKSSKENNDQ